MNTVEQVAGSYGRFSYNPDKQKNGVELGSEFEKLLGSHDDETVAPVSDPVSHAADDVPATVSTGAGAVLYLYNFLGEASVAELQSGANVNKLV